MIVIQSTELPGVFIVEPEVSNDERGSFTRIYSQRDFETHGVVFVPVQSSVSFNLHAGTLRGLHHQAAPHAEAKLVRCSVGAIFDVAVDLRPDSATFGSWFGAELNAANQRGMFIPPGVAHGFQTMVPETEVTYLVSEHYEPESQRGIRWDDPELAIGWPFAANRIISERDLALPYLER